MNNARTATKQNVFWVRCVFSGNGLNDGWSVRSQKWLGGCEWIVSSTTNSGLEGSKTGRKIQNETTRCDERQWWPVTAAALQRWLPLWHLCRLLRLCRPPCRSRACPSPQRPKILAVEVSPWQQGHAPAHPCFPPNPPRELLIGEEVVAQLSETTHASVNSTINVLRLCDTMQRWSATSFFFNRDFSHKKVW